MSIIKRIFESSDHLPQAKITNKRRRDNQSNDDKANTSNQSVLQDSYKILGLPQHSTWELVSKVRFVNDSYKTMLTEYDAMEEEVVIQAALELYADNATQMDTKSGNIVTVTSADESLQSELNDLLKTLKVDKRIWNWTYNLAKYGDVYSRVVNLDTLEKELEIVSDNGISDQIEELNKSSTKSDFILDDVLDGSVILDLYEHGQRVGFAEEDISEYSNLKHNRNKGLDLLLHSPNAFIHFSLPRTSQYEFLELVDHSKLDINKDPLIRKYTIQRGMSMIEGVRSIYRILQLLEDSLLAAQVAKSSYVRIYNIEVGNSTPEATTEIVNSVKSLFDSRITFDDKSGRYTSTKAIRPISDGVFNPTREGSGAISVDAVGGDLQVRDIADIDYFNSKLFSGLKVAKSLLGFEEALPYGNNEAITGLDIRLGRAIKRLQAGITAGIRDICNLHLEATGRNPLDFEYEVTLLSPSSAEELERMNEFQSRLGIIDSIIQSITASIGEHINVPHIYYTLLKKMTNYPDLIEELEPEFKKAIQSYKDKLDNPDKDEE